jgi:hypothetical protein
MDRIEYRPDQESVRAGGRGLGGRGGDPLSDVLVVLLPVLDAAVPSVDSQVAADALVGAFSTEYRCEQPGDDEALGRIRSYSGNALENVALISRPSGPVIWTWFSGSSGS